MTSVRLVTGIQINTNNIDKGRTWDKQRADQDHKDRALAASSHSHHAAECMPLNVFFTSQITWNQPREKIK